jgi:hypothetical protein
MPDQPNYRRIVQGSRLTLVERGSLWDGGDHLLLVRHRGYSESYRRIFYADLQAVVVGMSRRRAILAVVFGLPALAFYLGALANLRADGVIAAGLVAGGVLFTAFFIWNYMRGPTVRCEAQTEVQRLKLAGLTRLGHLERFLGVVRERVEAAQGAADPGVFEQAFATVEQSRAASPPDRSEAPPSSAAAPLRPPALHPDYLRLPWQKGLAGAIFLLALAHGLWFVWAHPMVLIFGVAALAGSIVVAAMAREKQRRFGAPESVTSSTTAIFVYLFAFALGAGALWMVSAVLDGPVSTAEQLYAMAERGPARSGVFFAGHLFILLTTVALGALALALARR